VVECESALRQHVHREYKHTHCMYSRANVPLCPKLKLPAQRRHGAHPSCRTAICAGGMWRAILLSVWGLWLCARPALAAAGVYDPPQHLSHPPTGNVTGIHDPSGLVRQGTALFVASTALDAGETGLRLHSSADGGATWARQANLLREPPSWIAQRVPLCSGGLWAPDLHVSANMHLGDGRREAASAAVVSVYYAASSFGSWVSCIGLATAASIHGPFEDGGPIVCTDGTQSYNAIDPHVFATAASDGLWMSLGSFQADGIVILPLDRASGRVPPGATPVPLARHFTPSLPTTSGTRMGGAAAVSLSSGVGIPNAWDGVVNAIEASWIDQHQGWFYLYANWGFCCRGVKSTYEIRVGRSRQVAGPYLDAANVSMWEGGGRSVLATQGA